MTDNISFVKRFDTPVLYRPKWWDKPRWWIVRALGGECPYDTFKTTRTVVDGATFMERLFAQRRELIYTFNRNASVLLIGAEDYEQLMQTATPWSAMYFQTRYLHASGEVYGIAVFVIPWMRGMIVLPDDLLDKGP